MSNKAPVNIRRNVDSYDDPYIDQRSLEETTVCKQCGSVYSAGRWSLKELVPKKTIIRQEAKKTLCPACRKLRDRVPGGVLKITGEFLRSHRQEIMNLIRNESNKARMVNPLEKIMTLEAIDDGIEITTTNEKLVQRIGKAIHKAYSGQIEYKWSEDTKLARVNWYRQA